MTETPTPRRTEYIRLAELKPNPRNVKGHDFETIDDSVKRFGVIDPIVRDDRTGYIISGHGRRETLTRMFQAGEDAPDGVVVNEAGEWLVSVGVGWASRTDAEAMAALIALNRTTELGGWVEDSLLDLLDDLTAEGDHGLIGVGFDEDDIDDLRLRLEDLADDDDNEDARTLAISSDGDRDEDSETGERPAPAAKDIPGVREMVTIHHGDCIEVMRTLADASIDAIVTDPPYGLGFMGKEWDDLPPGKEWAEECLRVLKPGGHVLAFGGSRTWHRLAAAVEDAGFDIRDSIAWLYGSGFPKSLDVAKAIDKDAGHWRGRAGEVESGNDAVSGGNYERTDKGAPVTPEAKRWAGWGTALKPAFEPIVVGRKPLDGTVAGNVLTHGTGALNIDGCRVEYQGPADFASAHGGNSGSNSRGEFLSTVGARPQSENIKAEGRWPSNVVLDDSQATELDRQSGVSSSSSRLGDRTGKDTGVLGAFSGQQNVVMGHDDEGGASRFFPTFRYEAKAPTSERPVVDGVAHPTVKPLDLMRWLVRLVTPPGGVVLEPFAGSGTTLEAAVLEGFSCIGIEREANYLPLIRQRLGIEETEAGALTTFSRSRLG
jgi:hypothetical protein